MCAGVARAFPQALALLAATWLVHTAGVRAQIQGVSLLGEGRCRSRNGKYPNYYWDQQLWLPETECAGTCRNLPACTAYQHRSSLGALRAECNVYGAGLTESGMPTGWTFRAGNGGDAIEQVTPVAGLVCRVKTTAAPTPASSTTVPAATLDSSQPDYNCKLRSC